MANASLSGMVSGVAGVGTHGFIGKSAVSSSTRNSFAFLPELHSTYPIGQEHKPKTSHLTVPDPVLQKITTLAFPAIHPNPKDRLVPPGGLEPPRGLPLNGF